MSKVQILGLKEVDRALQELPRATSKNVMRRVLRKRAEPIAFLATQYVPVDSGDLGNSIEIATRLTPRQRKYQRGKGFDIGADAVVLYVGSSSPVAHLQEFGTRHHAAQPFIRPAFEQLKHTVTEGLREDLWAEVKKSADRLARKNARLARRRAAGLE